MAIDPSIIAAGVAAIGSGASAYAQGKQNKKTRKWNEKMHALIRSEGLADYHMQNEYNSPEAQMDRLKRAKLNPNLVYGTGSLANEGAQVKPSGVESWNPQTPDIKGIATNAISTYYDARVKNVTVDNLAKAGAVMDEETRLKKAQTIATLASADKTDIETIMAKFNLDLETTLRETTIQGKQLDNEKKKADISYTLDQNDRAAVTTEMNLKQAAESILNSRKQRAKTDADIRHIDQQIENLKQDVRIKEYDEKSQEQGIPRNSPAWWRLLAELLMSGNKTPPSKNEQREIKIPQHTRKN